MTIAIAARGPNAGGAVWRALLAAELLGRGEISGACIFLWRDGKGAFQQAVTHSGGTAGLPELPPGWREAEMAAVIASGPERAEALPALLPFDPGAGLIAGHRQTTSRIATGEALNLAALALLKSGRLTTDTLAELLAAPGMDAGLICLPLKGPVLMANAPRVEARDDHGRHLREEGGRSVAVMLSAIHAAALAGHELADALGGIAAEELGLGPARHAIARLPDRLKVTADEAEAVHLDAEGCVCALHSADPAYGAIRPSITAVYSRMPVYLQGQLLGYAASEVLARLDTRELHARPGAAARSFVYRRL